MRRHVALTVTAATVLFAGCATGTSEPQSVASSPESNPRSARPSPPQLPRGGRTLLPNYRLVALYGTAGDGGGLGDLGVGTPLQAAARLERQAAAYARPGRPVLPVMELIVTVADPTPGPQGCYSHHIDTDDAWRYLRAARSRRQLLVVDVQPGQCDFLSQTRHWESLLTQPDVGLALDPEWRMPPRVAPGQQIGGVTATELNATTAWLAELTRKHNLPQKPVVLHQFVPNMITDKPALATPPELAVINHTDGFGSTAAKVSKYRDLTTPRLRPGFKLFYTEDTTLMTPTDVLALQPPPDYISYQ